MRGELVEVPDPGDVEGRDERAGGALGEQREPALEVAADGRAEGWTGLTGPKDYSSNVYIIQDSAYKTYLLAVCANAKTKIR